MICQPACPLRVPGLEWRVSGCLPGLPRPSGDPLTDERQDVADALRRLRDQVRSGQTPAERAPLDALGPALEARPPEKPQPGPQPAAPAPLSVPDPAPLGQSASLHGRWPGGLLGQLARRLLAPLLEAQSAWNARQAEWNSRLLAYVDARSDRTHRHYDEVLGVHSRHMADIDQRHLQLQEDLVGHVHDLVRRIDLVFSEGERSRLSLELELQDLRQRLLDLEKRLARG